MDNRREQLLWLVTYLAAERPKEGRPPTDMSEDDLWNAFRGLVNTREPWPASDEFFVRQDALLQSMIAEAGITSASDLPRCGADGRLSVWRGDITTLAADAIVNAANSQMLGCWRPGHFCIDNAIHTFAGVQLRLECNRLMQAQGHPEPTARAKVTPAYNLPSRWVIHTVGPIANGRPSARHERELAQAYRSCLEAASALEGCRSLAFCAISTGVFGFPQQRATEIATAAVRSWLDEHPACELHVIFNTFSASADALYRAILDPQ